MFVSGPRRIFGMQKRYGCQICLIKKLQEICSIHVWAGQPDNTCFAAQLCIFSFAPPGAVKGVTVFCFPRTSPSSSWRNCRTRSNTDLELEKVTNWDRTVTFWEMPPQADSILESANVWHIAVFWSVLISLYSKRAHSFVSDFWD